MSRSHGTPVDRLRSFLWSIGGAHPRLLADDSCWLERPRYTANGCAVLAVTGVAALSGAGTLASVVPGHSALMYAAGGLLWGGLILVLDRLLLLAIYKLESGRLSMSAWAIGLRICGAILIALCVSQTAELVLFKGKLDVQLAINQERDVAAQGARLNVRYGEIPTLEVERQHLLDQANASTAEADRASAAAACEADGTCGTGNPGANTIYIIKKQRADQLAGNARALAVRVNDQIREIDRRLTKLKLNRDQELSSFQQTTSRADDFLSRRAALAELRADRVQGLEVTLTGWIITLLSLFIELAPLVTKLTAPYGPYDAAFKSIQDSKAAAWRADGLKATGQIRRIVDQETMLNAAALTAYETLLLDATSAALTSEPARQAQADLEHEIVARSVRVARSAAASVFDEWLHDDVVATARAKRRAADDELVENELRKSNAFRAMDDAVRDAAETLRDPDAPLH